MHGWFTLSNILYRQNEKSIHTLLKLRTIRADKLVIDSFVTALDNRIFHPGGPIATRRAKRQCQRGWINRASL